MSRTFFSEKNIIFCNVFDNEIEHVFDIDLCIRGYDKNEYILVCFLVGVSPATTSHRC
jgi:hypothetical protein